MFERCVLALLLARGGLRALRGAGRPLLVQGVVFSTIPFVLLAWASMSMTAGLTAILNATAPLFAANVAHLWLAERIGRWRALGLALGRVEPRTRPSRTMAAMPRAAADSRCPCGRDAAYAACCGRWHAGPLHLAAPDAEALMRSRYCAYVLGLEPYLRDTWHAGTRPAALSLDPATKWLGLEIRAHRRIDETHATVEFVARCRDAGRATRLHETSRFVHEAGRWLYVDGELR